VQEHMQMRSALRRRALAIIRIAKVGGLTCIGF